MAQVEILMPKLGESVMEATITKWSKNVGDTVDMDETIVEIATDKVDSEVPSTARGVLVKRLHEEGAVVQIGDAFAIIETDADNPGTTVTLSASVAETSPAEAAPAQAAGIENEIRTISDNHTSVSSTGDRFYSPLVKSIAREEGITQEELDAVAGSGKDGRVTKDDIMAYLKQGRKPATAPAQTQTAAAQQPATQAQPAAQQAKVVQEKPVQGPPVSANAGDDIIEMDRMRKLIADHMVMSKRVSPHVTSFVEADVTNIVLWRDKVKDAFQKMTGEKLTFTPIFMEAVVRAIKDFPGVNASVDGDRIIMRKNINVGMATALPSGNLIVPVIKNADTMNLTGLTKAVNDMAARARAGKLTPDDIAGGTYTVSNVGTFGNVMGTPIINQPQVAILALGAVRKRPAVIETEYGDVIAVRHMMFLSHSYDHRVVDGALGGSFVRRVADYLEQFDPNRTF
ncbi:MAG: 2-oxo acid dehydrogenase subunit E2 [Bacteroidia bacterium]|nr:2-oxo acid dehydrogenase subunit E2 [Bacteroidia bacterium]